MTEDVPDRGGRTLEHAIMPEFKRRKGESFQAQQKRNPRQQRDYKGFQQKSHYKGKYK